MSALLERSPSRAGITIPTIWLALFLSLLVHIAALWKLPQVKLPPEDPSLRAPPLVVELERAPRPPPVRPRAPRIEPPAAPPKRAERVRPEPPRIARPAPEPRRTPPPSSTAEPRVAPSPPQPKGPGIALPPSPPRPGAADLASYVEAQRRARGEAAPPTPAAEPAPRQKAETENERANRIAAANLGIDRRPTFGPDRRKSGGVFEVTRMSYDYAEFVFYGWNNEIRRDTMQTIDVRKGDNPDIKIAVVRRMIAIIRQYENEDFVWESHRLGRNVTLSARARDSRGLEEFLMREFFEAGPAARR